MARKGPITADLGANIKALEEERGQLRAADEVAEATGHIQDAQARKHIKVNLHGLTARAARHAGKAFEAADNSGR